MSRLFRDDSDHLRARELAALEIDEPLAGPDAGWLDLHLASCPDCAAVADAYRADRLLFAPLRDAAPQPPRDLWARTAAAIDAEAGSGRAASTKRGLQLRGVSLTSLAPIVGVAAVAVIAGSLLLNGATVAPGSGSPSAPGATAMALDPGRVAVVTRGADGSLSVVTAGVGEICPLVTEQCGAAAPSFETSPLVGLSASDDIAAIISPQRDHLVVVQRNAAGADGVFVVPVRPAKPVATSAGGSTAPATPATASPEPGRTASSTVTESPQAASPSPDRTSTPTATDEPGASPVSSPSDDPSASPSEQPVETPTVEVSPAPGGAIEIASDVIVVGVTASYDADGNHFAFTARPSDGSAGPDVFVWSTSDARARAFTTDHGSVFAGWDGAELLVSRVVDDTPLTVRIDLATGKPADAPALPGWLPVVAPDGAAAVWWDGSVRLAADGVTWVPDKGRLVIGAWPDGSAGAQPVAHGDVRDWEVHWAPDGMVVAVWIAGGDDGLGSLSLYAVDPETGKARLGKPLLKDEPAFGGFSLDVGHVAYSAPGADGGPVVWVLGWAGDSVGKVKVPGDVGATVIH
jgi:hypothetical protein